MKRLQPVDDLSKYLKLLGTKVEVRVDRPMGSVHPDYDFVVYRTNYGYIPGTAAGDGEEIDAYILGIDKPVERFEGTCIAVIVRRDDEEHKVVVAPHPLSRERVLQEIAYVESHYDTDVIVAAGGGDSD